MVQSVFIVKCDECNRVLGNSVIAGAVMIIEDENDAKRVWLNDDGVQICPTCSGNISNEDTKTELTVSSFDQPSNVTYMTYKYKDIDFNLEQDDEGVSLQHDEYPVLCGYGDNLHDAEHELFLAIEEMRKTLLETPDEQLSEYSLRLKDFLLNNLN